MPKGHKDNCLCTVCQQRRKKLVVATVAVPLEIVPVVAPSVIAPKPVEVPAGSLKPNEKFEFNGQLYRAGMKAADCILGTNITQPGVAAVTLGLNTMVKVIK